MESRADEIKKALNENCSEEHCRKGGRQEEGREELHSCFLSCPLKLPLCWGFLIKMVFLGGCWDLLLLVLDGGEVRREHPKAGGVTGEAEMWC